MAEIKGWIGVDLDGTLAHWNPEIFPEIGAPIPRMVERVREWLAEGRDVRIFTARADVTIHNPEAYPEGMRADVFQADQRLRIRAWCVEHLGRPLQITAIKDFQMIELWDDRAVQMVSNTGITITEYRAGYQTRMQ